MDKVISMPQTIGATDFTSVLRPHMTPLYRMAYRLTGSPSDAEDLLQDTLVKAYGRRHQLAEIEQLRAWLLRVLHNTYIDQQRSKARSPLRLITRKPQESNDPDDAYEQIPSPAPGPDKLMEQKQTSAILQSAINALPADQRHICLLHDVEGYSFPEIMEILKVPLGTIKSRLHRGRENLRKLLRSGTF